MRLWRTTNSRSQCRITSGKGKHWAGRKRLPLQWFRKYHSNWQALLMYISKVWKSGVTDAPGQGAGIQCKLWSSTGTISMTYLTDSINNDQYKRHMDGW